MARSYKKKIKNQFHLKNLPFLLFLVLLVWIISFLNVKVSNNTKPLNESKTPAPQIETKPTFPDDMLDVGIYSFDEVIDGDTIRIIENDKPLRLLCVDTEETFKPYQAKQKELADKDWKAYLTLKNKGKKFRPLKYPTPYGDETSKFAEEFFKGVEKVKIERDSLDRLIDFFDRPLCYVFIEKDNEWLNYNVELVRKGYSPYYAKYGYSLRYHDEFVTAEKEAKGKKMGIWNPKGKHYIDYPERIEWWNERGEAINNFESQFGSNESYFLIQNDTDWERLGDYIGKEITIFGTVDRVRLRNKPYWVFVSHKQNRSVILYSENDAIIERSKDAMKKEEYIYFTGRLELVNDDYMMRFEEISQMQTTEEMLKQLVPFQEK